MRICVSLGERRPSRACASVVTITVKMLTPIADATASVLKITGRLLSRLPPDAHIDKFKKMSPLYKHVRLIRNMLISPEGTPKDELFQRNDNDYAYLKPDDVSDE